MTDPIARALGQETAAGPVWQPDETRIRDAVITRFASSAGIASTETVSGSPLHRWSVDNPDGFWRLVWHFTQIVGEPGKRVVDAYDRMPGARFFPDARLNVAANLLRWRGSDPAIIFEGETGRRTTLSRDDLADSVTRCAAALRRHGIAPGDRVAGYLPNLPETVIAALAAAAIGAVWSSCSPDFGVQGVIDRFGQIAPRVLIAADGYVYNGKRHDQVGRLKEVLAGLPTVERTVLVPYVDERPSLDGLPRAERWDDFLGSAAPLPTTSFERFPFDHPLAILYSSGTTGVPKCIVHGAGGTLIQHLKELQLHCDVRAGDRVFYYTTCGWMMWNWLVSALAAGAAIVLYDGAPMHRDGRVLFDLADAAGVTLFGTSARFLDAAAKAGLTPRETHNLRTVRTITSTGSPLAPATFDYVYRAIKPDVHLASISGGTDIVGCFVGGNPTRPVWRGEIQTALLGMDVAVFDDSGTAVVGRKGELVCRRPFPSMPLGFWNDSDGRRYHAAYFERYPGVWHHGDWIEETTHGGYVIEGRSDAVLNPGGVRIGTAEIYRQVERVDEVLESLAVGQHWDGDVRIVLFVRLRPGVALTDELKDRIRRTIRAQATPRHVPAVILDVPDLPRTRSGKIVELAVRDVVDGRQVGNVEAIANPEALEAFRDRPELRS